MCVRACVRVYICICIFYGPVRHKCGRWGPPGIVAEWPVELRVETGTKTFQPHIPLMSFPEILLSNASVENSRVDRPFGGKKSFFITLKNFNPTSPGCEFHAFLLV